MQTWTIRNIEDALKEANLLLKIGNTSNTIPLNGSFKVRAEDLKKGDIFICFRGTRFDAHDFIPTAIEKGASLLIAENEKKIKNISLPYFLVTDSRKAWSVVTSLSLNHPQRSLKFIGVTGTDGKSSTVWMASELLRICSNPCLSLGTLGAYDGEEHWPLEHTSPDPPAFYSALTHSLRKKLPTVIMEVSSHSLMQGKLEGILFDLGVLTSFSREHLDFHQTMEEYWKAKMLLFNRHLKKDGKAIINYRFLEKVGQEIPKERILSYGFDPKNSSSIDAQILETEPSKLGQKIRFRYKNLTHEGEIPYLGIHNAENFLASILIVEQFTGVLPSPSLWSHLASIPGRCERVHKNEKTPRIFVDFAHSPNGIETILQALKPHTKGHLWIVFGCGGDRDKGKRPEMASTAERYADRLVITSDNPRSEDPLEIIQNIESGLNSKTNVFTIKSREEAIEFAIKSASIEDTILIAGRGHETHQIVGNNKIPFIDKEKAIYYLNKHWES